MKISLGKHRHGWEDRKIDLKEIGNQDVEKIHLAQDQDNKWALVNELFGPIKSRAFPDYIVITTVNNNTNSNTVVTIIIGSC